jgi:hypothetical protein
MRSKPLTVVFCPPGSSFSGKFIQCWSNLLAWCLCNGIKPIVSQQRSCNIYYVRNMCLGGDVLRGPRHKPFDGKLDYDYIMWIDSDILFEPQQFQRLLGHGTDIVAGLYLMEGGKQFAAVEQWDEEYFAQHGCFRFLTPADLQGKEGLLQMAYTGMGFMLVKRGVFEAMEYPWFRPMEKRTGQAVDFTMEDVGFCLRAREVGVAILVDEAVRMKHVKAIPL